MTERLRDNVSPTGYRRRVRAGQLARRTVGWLTAFGCLVLTGCSAGSAGSAGSGGASASAAAAATAGPLGEGGSQGTLCSPVAEGQALSDGFDPLMNSGRSPATIEAVSLADPRHLVLLTAYVVPITGGFLYGVHAGYPPAPDLGPGVLWSRRQLAVGATIPRSGPGHIANLLLVVKPTGRTGTAAGVLIAYRVAGQLYQFQSRIKLIVEADRQCPSG